MPKGAAVPIEALVTLRRRLAALPARHPDRKQLLGSTIQLYAMSRATLYRLLGGDRRSARRTDWGCTRAMPVGEIEHLCETAAAMKIRTTNRRGRHLWSWSCWRRTASIRREPYRTIRREAGRNPSAPLRRSRSGTITRAFGRDARRRTGDMMGLNYIAHRDGYGLLAREACPLCAGALPFRSERLRNSVVGSIVAGLGLHFSEP